MTVATFDTEYGSIEVKRCNSDGSWSGVAYFFKQDWESPVDSGGRFRDSNGVDFQVFWPGFFGGDAALEVTIPRTIARAKTDQTKPLNVA